MIVSNLQNSQRVEKLHPLFKQLFDYVKSHDLLHEELGTIRLDGDNLIVNNIYPECIPEGKRSRRRGSAPQPRGGRRSRP